VGVWSGFKTYLRTGVFARRSSVDRYSQWEILAPAYTMVDEEAYVRDGYRANASVYRCVEVLARSVGIPLLYAAQRTPEGDAPLVERDPLSLLLARPGGEEYGSQTRWLAQVVRRLMLTGECVLYKVPGERTGRIVELQILPSSRVEVERDAKGHKTYVYRYDATKRPLRLKPEFTISIAQPGVSKAKVSNVSSESKFGFWLTSGGELLGKIRYNSGQVVPRRHAPKWGDCRCASLPCCRT